MNCSVPSVLPKGKHRANQVNCPTGNQLNTTPGCWDGRPREKVKGSWVKQRERKKEGIQSKRVQFILILQKTFPALFSCILELPPQIVIEGVSGPAVSSLNTLSNPVKPQWRRSRFRKNNLRSCRSIILPKISPLLLSSTVEPPISGHPRDLYGSDRFTAAVRLIREIVCHHAKNGT